MRCCLLLFFVFLPVSLGIQKIRFPSSRLSFLSSTWEKIKLWWSQQEAKTAAANSWQCGSKTIALSQKLAQIFTRTACPGLYSTVNTACIRHDECYDDLTTSRAHCDQVFCHALRDMDLDEEASCWIQETFCFMVKNFGQFVFTKKIGEEDDDGTLPI